MARMALTRTKPENPQILVAAVVRRTSISPNMARVTLGGPALDLFQPLGYDQWFRLFLPVTDTSFEHLPRTFGVASYAKLLTVPRSVRPVLRNYTVRAFRPGAAGEAELDIDFVLHSGDGDHGPAASWARSCVPGDLAAIIDEGITVPQAGPGSRHLLVGDESALPAIAGILASLPRDARGTALVEIAHPDDAQDLGGPDGVAVRWLPRADSRAVPGAHALEELASTPLPDGPFRAFAAGEQALASGARRALVARGVPKEDITFVGYWRHGKSSP